MRSPEYFERFGERGFVGLKFIWAWVSYDDEILCPVYEKAESLVIPILFHTGTALAR